MQAKPKTIDEYRNWLHDKHNVQISRVKNHYDSVVNKIQADVQKSELWESLNGCLTTIDQKYLIKTRSPLLLNYDRLNLRVKTFESFLTKTFRKNVSENEKWPEPPNGGWLLPENWIGRINDIVRSLLVVKYFDGVLFAADELTQLVESKGLRCKKSLEARSEGYYAAHLYASVPVEIPRITWDTEITVIQVEIQITTQVQEVIRSLLHAHYERRRIATDSDANSPWQWDYTSLEFSTNYLGHVLHYIDGMIVDIRDRKE